ncbi:YrrS family protein [Jeotgalibacillus salarius]|uniref:DUF1510 family protein n=1 Tax=Jeotgalibacillus salarius TaxID=546023 RepID=A0A4Y8LFS1_9BACL|nr:YrrS family protein [Jeotgalibacillus salarius]TFE01076.1 DUF1510 family protein [Jeotgalibacillus salarius]
MNNSRAKVQSKKRKQNILLNGSIAVVFLLIAGVSAFIFLGDNENQAAETSEEKTIAEQVQENSGVEDENEDSSDQGENNELSASEIESEEKENTDEKNETQSSEEVEEKKKEDEQKEEQQKQDEEKEEQQKRDEEKEDAENDRETASPQDGEWKPVGTKQTGEHVSSYEEGSVDWNEKLKAAAYATGLDTSTMTVWWVGNDGGPQKSVVEVSSSAGGQAEYRVHMEWVDKKGWKPVKVDEL